MTFTVNTFAVVLSAAGASRPDGTCTPFAGGKKTVLAHL